MSCMPRMVSVENSIGSDAQCRDKVNRPSIADVLISWATPCASAVGFEQGSRGGLVKTVFLSS